MKMLLIVCPDFRQADLRKIIWKHDIHAYSELKDVTGEGLSGKRLGTRVWPDKSIMVFTVIADEKKDALLDELRHCARQLYPGEGLRAFVLPVEEAV